MMIGTAVLGILAIALAVAAFRWARRPDQAQEVSANSAQIERDVYEHLYGEPSARITAAPSLERSPEGETEMRRGQRTRADRTDPRAGRAPGTRVTGRAVRGPMQQT